MLGGDGHQHDPLSPQFGTRVFQIATILVAASTMLAVVYSWHSEFLSLDALNHHTPAGQERES
jgi:hypothetical protein